MAERCRWNSTLDCRRFAFGSRVVYGIAFVCTANSGKVRRTWPISEAHVDIATAKVKSMLALFERNCVAFP